MRFRFLISVFILSALVMAGCTRIERVRAIEGDMDVPYDSLGILEVKISSKPLPFSALGWGVLRILSFGRVDAPSWGEQYKSKLRAELTRKARLQYKADALVKVHYWPEPEGNFFPNGYVYARGEMIKYNKFPADDLAPEPLPV